MIDERVWFGFSTIDFARGECSWRVADDLPYFEGHFPGNPILPAFAIVDGSLEAVRAVFRLDDTPYVTTLRSAKFAEPIQPFTDVLIRCIEDSSNRYTITWFVQDRIVAKLTVDCEPHR